VLAPYIDVLKAVAHPLRIKIIDYIHFHNEVNVNKIYSALGLEQSITSQHLKLMREAGIVIHRKTERFVFYSLNYKILAEVGQALSMMKAV
jgi:ArsR family transcriptional regulator